MFKVGEFPSVQYKCPMCKRDFEKHADASNCIANHVTPLLIASFDDIDINGPETITVLFSNGTKGRYELAQVIENVTA